MAEFERKVLFEYDEPKEVGTHKIKRIKKVPRGIRFRTENGPILIEDVEVKDSYTEEELLALLPQ
jgi:hypothetical protein